MANIATDFFRKKYGQGAEAPQNVVVLMDLDLFLARDKTFRDALDFIKEMKKSGVMVGIVTDEYNGDKIDSLKRFLAENRVRVDSFVSFKEVYEDVHGVQYNTSDYGANKDELREVISNKYGRADSAYVANLSFRKMGLAEKVKDLHVITIGLDNTYELGFANKILHGLNKEDRNTYPPVNTVHAMLFPFRLNERDAGVRDNFAEDVSYNGVKIHNCEGFSQIFGFVESMIGARQVFAGHYKNVTDAPFLARSLPGGGRGH